MLKLFNKSSVLGTSTRLLASASVAAPLQHERDISSKKAVVLNMAGCVVPAMSPVLTKYARQHEISESELISKLFKHGDKNLMEEVEPALLSRHGAEDASLAHVVSAVKSIRGEGLKVGLVDGGHALKSDLIPLDKSLFDVTSPSLKPDLFDRLKVDSSDCIYLDNIEANLKAAQALGMEPIKVEDIEKTLTELESVLQVPLKEFLPDLTWIYYDNANNPHKSTSENLLYYFLWLYIFVAMGHFTLKYVLKLDGTAQH